MAYLECPIWGTRAQETRDSGGGIIHVYSHRAGGTYSISGSAVSVLKSTPTKDKLLLTRWLCEQRAVGVAHPLITTSTLNDVKAWRPLSVSRRISSALLFFNGLRLGEAVTVHDRDFSDDEPAASALAAWTECENKGELLALLGLMAEMQFLTNRTRIVGKWEYLPTAKGWMRIEELVESVPDKAQAFVAMWFSPTTESAYNHGIAKAITNCGYRPVRIDKREHVNKIDDEIIAEIRRSRFVVADFTCEKEKVRGGVYYEAGYAAGLSILVIWTCHKDSLDDLHFDTRQYNHIVWETPDDLHRKLEARIGALLGDGPIPRPATDK